ncbi:MULTISPECIES: hypothetical protein [Streptomyces]|uniref:Uncharacterized protein n=1 Tax=Streptomyces avermitilis (strain ATCC 31267 / DSM 46492 / JCM 5070 / NBRC 14893 / NCIMB 12804 / NRRL 8165 / MA-4680) TaxID=227882 RepID=Q82G06_STRAW|nr:hypothetical protein [Streptomyces avermitilis]OOV32081.1 hypothetical protein SM007_04185 [Streptomyces avermitilis]BAC71805.1 hypothetical protein SAVERM_4093 [Streptomyces avermitilis MA-4680 = NBRC 14893]
MSYLCEGWTPGKFPEGRTASQRLREWIDAGEGGLDAVDLLTEVSAELSRAVLERLRAVDWHGDWDVANSHTRSRALLMREYMRRAALWARAYGAEAEWPFFDVTEFLDPTFQLDPEVASELEEYLAHNVGTPSTARTCRGAVRWAALRAVRGDDFPALPDPYEPLLLMYGRGGGYSIEEFIDLYGVMIPYGNFDSSLNAEPFLSLAPSTLDALDAWAEGRITYYAKISEGYPRSSPRGILRRRLVGREAETHDEAFTRNLRWEPTEYLRLYELGHNDVDHVQISEREAAAFIEAVTKKLTGVR